VRYDPRGGGNDLDLSDEEKLALADLLRGAIDAYR